MNKIVIAAAAGNIGRRTAKQLSDKGFAPILLGHNLENLMRLDIPNGIVVETDLGNPEEVIQATQGADALLWLVPPVLHVTSLKDWYQKVTQAGIAAVRENKIKRVVLISSLGAGAAEDLGTITYAGEMEKEFDRLDVNVLALRPGYFMENFLLQVQEISSKDEFSFTYSSDHDIPFISTDDIGNAAAAYLSDATWAGHWKLNLMGPENITPTEAASRLSVLLGRPIHYRQGLIEDASRMMGNWGANTAVQDEMADLFAALGDPNGVYATARTPEAFTFTTFDAFLKAKLMPLL